MNKHTPGPWVISERVKTARLDNALMVRPADHHNHEYGGTAIIATSEADARLIAAAPDLLAACWALFTSFHALEYIEPHMKQAADMGRAAIAKATGETK